MNDDEYLSTLSSQLIKTIFDDISSDYSNGFINDNIKEIEQRMI